MIDPLVVLPPGGANVWIASVARGFGPAIAAATG